MLCLEGGQDALRDAAIAAHKGLPGVQGVRDAAIAALKGLPGDQVGAAATLVVCMDAETQANDDAAVTARALEVQQKRRVAEALAQAEDWKAKLAEESAKKLAFGAENSAKVRACPCVRACFLDSCATCGGLVFLVTLRFACVVPSLLPDPC